MMFKFLLAFILSTLPASNAAVRLAVSLDAPQDNNAKIIEPTISALTKQFGKKELIVVKYALPQLEKALENGDVDIFLSTSGLSRRMAQKGAKDIVTLASSRLPDPNHAYGTLFFVRKDSPVKTIKDMRGKTLATNLIGGFYGHQIGMGELAARGYNPNNFFGKEIYVGRDLRSVVDKVLKGEADVGSVSSCFLEDTYKLKDPVWEKIRPIEPKQGIGPCLSSTNLYPNWSVSTMPTTSPLIAEKTAIALLKMPAIEDGFRWSIATDFSSTDALFRELKLGPFGFLSEWFSREFRNRYGLTILIACCIMAFLLLNNLILRYIVKKRTASLVIALDNQKQLRKKEKFANERLTRLQRIGVVGQLSSLIVHDLRQPLTTISAFVYGALKKSHTGVLNKTEIETVLGKIQKQAVKAEGIVENVRSYAKSKTVPRHLLFIDQVIKEAVQTFTDSHVYSGELIVDINCRPKILMSPLELELAIVNLLNNSADSLYRNQIKKPSIRVSLSESNENILVEVFDNGKLTSTLPKDIPNESNKQNGLGLGLSIVNSIMQNHGGRMEILPFDGGVKATLYFPLNK